MDSSSFKVSLVSASTLARFANLKNAGIQGFRKECSAFLPETWWDESRTTLTGEGDPDIASWFREWSEPLHDAHGKPLWQPLWKHVQKRVREAWEQHFSDKWIAAELIGAVWATEMEKHEDRFLDSAGHPSSPLTFIGAASHKSSCGFQEAVAFLAEHGWRAKFCKQCGERFVAEAQQRKCCSQVCSGKQYSESRKERRAILFRDPKRRARILKGKRATWKRHGKTYRANAEKNKRALLKMEAAQKDVAAQAVY